MTQVTLTKDARGFVDGVVSYLRDDKRSSAVVPRVQTLLSKVSAAARRQKTAKVTTSVALTPKEVSQLEVVLSRFLGHEVEVDVIVSPELLGGFRINVGDWVVDTSLETSLEAMGQSLQ